MRDFFLSLGYILSRRGLVFVVMNLVFFVSLFFGVLLAHFQYPPVPYGGELEPIGVIELFSDGGLLMMFVEIFLSNLVLSAFVFVTLSGLVFFALPAAVMVWRALVWVLLLSWVPTPQFLALIPTLILEGEGYVFASAAGINLGLSWLKPNWIFKGEQLSRWDSLKMALKECLLIYVFVTLLLFFAAVVEVTTLFIFAV